LRNDEQVTSLGKHLPSLLNETSALLSHQNPPCRAFENGDAHPRLKPSHLRGKRRLGDAAMLCGTHETAVIGNGHHVLEIA
jgi:hypothetical protein